MADKPDYIMTRTWTAASRLNLQHYFLAQHLNGCLLDPKIPRNSTDLTIGDVCCGTGIWLMSLANELPTSANFHALDINFEQFPHRSLWPENLTCHTYNVFDAPPRHLVARFDIINVSLTVTFVNDAMVDTVVGNIASLLKPGGYLQWQEIDPAVATSPRSDRDPDVPPPEFVDKCIPYAWECNRLQPPKWIVRLEEKLETAGLELVSSTRPAPDPKLLNVSTQLVLMGLEEFVSRMKEQTGLDATAKESTKRLDEIIAKAWVEHQKTGNSIWVPVVRAVGLKQRL